MASVRIPIKDACGDMMRLETLRQSLNSIPDIAKKGLRMHNQAKLQGSNFLITDFSIEVDDSVEAAVKKAVQSAGFILRGTPLADRPNVQKDVSVLVQHHLEDNQESQLEYAVWFRLEDPQDIHLLEIANGVLDPGSGALEGVALTAGSAIPDARAIVIYLASPTEFRKALKVNPNHPAVVAVKEDNAILVFPKGRLKQLRDKFGIVRL